MGDEALRKSLERLSRYLDELDEGDEISRKKLGRIIEDIHRRLNDEDIDDEKSLSSQAKDAVMHFEVKHPKITAILNEISVTLSNMGL